MRSRSLYLIGYLFLMGALMAGLWKTGVLERIGAVWTFIIIAAMIGIGIMLAVSKVGEVKIRE